MSIPKRVFTNSAFQQSNAPTNGSGTYVDADTQMRLTAMSMRVRKSVNEGYLTAPTSFQTYQPPTSPTPIHPQTSFTSFLSDSSARSLAFNSIPPPPPNSMDTSSDPTNPSRRRRRSPGPPSAPSAAYNGSQDPYAAFGSGAGGGGSSMFPASHEAPGPSTFANRPIRAMKRTLRPTQSLPVSHSSGGGGWISQQGEEQRALQMQREEGAWTPLQFGDWAKKDDGF